MVGFPGETDEDFEATSNFLKEMQFDNVVLFPYQDRAMTDAHQMPDKVPANVIRKRVKRLRHFINRASVSG
jgi:tRNA A37 methylthiotransferase MiaB